MKKNFLLILLIFCFAIIPLNVNAEECTDEEIERLEKIVENININFEYDEDNLFKVTLNNMPEYITGSSLLGMFETSSDKTTNFVDGFVGGTMYQIFFLANEKNNCGMKVLQSKSITIPLYNNYSESEICEKEEYKDFEYCSKFIDKQITEEEFNNKLKSYSKKEETKNVLKENNYFKFFKQNYILIIGGIVTAIMIIVIIKIFNRRKKYIRM